MHGYEGRVPLSIYPYILGSAIIFFCNSLCSRYIPGSKSHVSTKSLIKMFGFVFIYLRTIFKYTDKVKYISQIQFHKK